MTAGATCQLHFFVGYHTVTIVSCDHIIITLCKLEAVHDANQEATAALSSTLAAVKTGLDMRLHHHKALGWAGGWPGRVSDSTPLVPTAMVDSSTDDYQSFSPYTPRRTGR